MYMALMIELTTNKKKYLKEKALSLHFIVGGRCRIQCQHLQFSKIQLSVKIGPMPLNKCILIYSYKKLKKKNWSCLSENFENDRGFM